MKFWESMVEFGNDEEFIDDLKGMEVAAGRDFRYFVQKLLLALFDYYGEMVSRAASKIFQVLLHVFDTKGVQHRLCQ